MEEILNIQNKIINENIYDLMDFIEDEDFIKLIKLKKIYSNNIKDFIYELYCNHLDKSLKYVIDNRPF